MVRIPPCSTGVAGVLSLCLQCNPRSLPRFLRHDKGSSPPSGAALGLRCLLPREPTVSARTSLFLDGPETSPGSSLSNPSNPVPILDCEEVCRGSLPRLRLATRFLQARDLSEQTVSAHPVKPCKGGVLASPGRLIRSPDSTQARGAGQQ